MVHFVLEMVVDSVVTAFVLFVLLSDLKIFFLSAVLSVELQ